MIVQADFNNADYDIIPVADPNNTTMLQRLMKAKAMLELRGQGLNDIEIMRRYLLAMDINDIDALFPQEQEQDPVKQLTIQKLQEEIKEISAKVEKLQSETELNYAKIESEYHGQQKKNADIANDQRKLDINETQVLGQLELGRSQQSLGKAPGGLTDNTLKKEYGIETNK